MAMEKPNDHDVVVKSISTVGHDAESIGTVVKLEVEKLFNDAKKAGGFVAAHTVTYFHDLETVVMTAHTIKA